SRSSRSPRCARAVFCAGGVGGDAAETAGELMRGSAQRLDDAFAPARRFLEQQLRSGDVDRGDRLAGAVEDGKARGANAGGVMAVAPGIARGTIRGQDRMEALQRSRRVLGERSELYVPKQFGDALRRPVRQDDAAKRRGI